MFLELAKPRPFRSSDTCTFPSFLSLALHVVPCLALFLFLLVYFRLAFLRMARERSLHLTTAPKGGGILFN